MRNLLLLALGLYLVLLSSRLVECEVHYIIPTSSDPCPEETCLTLSQFAANANNFLDSNATLLLLPGNHSLDTNLAVTNLESFKILSNYTTAAGPMLSSDSRDTKIICSRLSMINFNTVAELYIIGIEFIRCGGISIHSVNNFTLVNSYFDGRKAGRTALQVTETIAVILATTFVSNSNHLGIIRPRSDTFHGFSSNLKVGGAIFAERSTITLLSSIFEQNSAEKGGAIYCDKGSNVTIINSTFVGNYAVCPRGRPGMFTQVFNGGAIAVYYSQINSSHSHFNSNRACKDGGSHFAWYSVTSSDSDHFNNNSAGSNGGAISAYKSTTSSCGSHFENNRADKNGGVVFMEKSSTLNITRSYFNDNNARSRGGVILASGSTLNSHSSHFSSNRALHGGVISIDDTKDGSTINSKNDYFKDNSATFSGGVLHLTNLFKLKSARINCYNDRFVSNSAGWYGGVVLADKSIMHSSNNSYINNSAKFGAGVMMLTRSSTAACNNDHIDNNRAGNGGVLVARSSTINYNNSSFTNNSANVDAGVMILAEGSTAESSNNHFQGNRAGRDGGVILTEESTISSASDSFDGNRAGRDGGVFHCTNGVLFRDSSIERGTFMWNRASHDGGVVYSYQGNITANMVTAWGNSANKDGGVFKLLQGSLQISMGNFSNSTAHYGGVICADHLTLSLNRSTFSENAAMVGAVFYISGSNYNGLDSLTLAGNKAASAVVYLMDSSARLSGHTTFSENFGSFVATMSNVTFLNSAIFINNSYYQLSDVQAVHTELGGAITALHSMLMFHGDCHLNHNQAQSGGAIRSIRSRIDVHGNLSFANNLASESGGGVHLYQSELTCHHYSTLVLLGNNAGVNGGGVHAFSSNINLKSNKSSISTDLKLHFIDNLAEKGGGVYLEMNSVIYIHKYAPSTESYPILKFTTNLAYYGGAIFNPDNTKFGMCTYFKNRTHSVPNECSIQILSLYGTMFSGLESSDMSQQNVYFSGNNATSGSSLYGGMLDKCTVSSMAHESSNIMGDELDAGLTYLETISDIQRSDIGSPPLKVCFCRDSQPDCDLQLHPPMHIDRGDTVTVPVVVFDEAGNPIKDASVYASLSSNNSNLCRHQQDQSTPLHGECAGLTFRAFSIRASEDLILQIENSPCEHTVPHHIQVPLQFPWCDNCPIGFRRFEDQELGCRCDCHPDIKYYFSNCDSKTQMLQKGSSAWIAYVNSSNHSRGFIIHPHCPLDYCKPTISPIYINFNEENGANAQCAHNRSGMLCGSCPPDLSLSLGSSRCLTCPKLWPLQTIGIIVSAFLVGIALVAVLLAINLTVAVGTLNGIIFYANIVAANSKIFLPFTQPNFITVFISWLNMEFGIDTCFFEGMDAYWKAWLQLAFPAYVVFLVVTIIAITECSTRFAHLIGKKNPMATLTTLILLSYTKFLHTIIAAFSFATIRYPDGSSQIIWLPDATIGYLRGRHIVLFLAAIFIVVLSIVYTALLFSWQWLLHYQHKTAFGWVRNQKLCQFLEPYHAPYSFKHRYWTGLLLLVRVVLYVISAINVSGDPRVALVSTVILVTFLLLLKGFLGVRLYKKTFVDLLEVFMYFNLLMFSALSWYTLDSNPRAQASIAYTSVSITIILLIIVLVYHIYKYTGTITKLRRSLHFKKMFANLKSPLHKEEQEFNRQNKCDNPPDFCQVIDERAKTTYTVVEVFKPQLQKPELRDPKEFENKPIPNPESKKQSVITVELVLENALGEQAATLQSGIQVSSSKCFSQGDQGMKLSESKIEISASSKISDSPGECNDTHLDIDVCKDGMMKKDLSQKDIKQDVKDIIHSNNSDESTATAKAAVNYKEDTGFEMEEIVKQPATTQPLVPSVAKIQVSEELDDCQGAEQLSYCSIDSDTCKDVFTQPANINTTTTMSCMALKV